MTKRREPHGVHARSEGMELRSRRKRAAAPAPAAVHGVSNEDFLQAFADALRDILRDERRHAA